jgi:hypothetical protein
MDKYPSVAMIFSDDWPGAQAYSWTSEEELAFFGKVWETIKKVDSTAEEFEAGVKPDEGYDAILFVQEWQAGAPPYLIKNVIEEFSAS